MSTKAPFTQEKTFSSYNQAQGEAYANLRPKYHPGIYQMIIDHHTSTGGHFDVLLDVGCGPGMATHALVPKFSHVLGLDPSEGMIATARAHNERTPTTNVRFEVSTAEDLGSNLSPPVQDTSVDLIISANAAHWFNIPAFWAAAARVLKPSGTVALWAPCGPAIHPSTPNASAIQAAIQKIQEDYLAPFYEPGNLLTQNRYAEFPLPWDMDEPVTAFDKESFIRREWGVDEEFFDREPVLSLDQVEKIMGVGSPVTRWREANPGAVGTEEDVVRVCRRTVEKILHEAGVEEGREVIRGGSMGVLLIVKHKGCE
jgi:SAM-dependent methyltransferase